MAVAFKEAVDSNVVFTVFFVDRILFRSQLDGRVNGQKRIRDLISLSVCTSPDPYSDGRDDDVTLES